MTKLLLTLVAAATVAFAADSFLGSWKPNLEKSKLSPKELERRKVGVLTIESAGKDTYQIVPTRPDGSTANTKPDIWIVDGKEHQEQRSGRVYTVKVERINERHLRTSISSGERAIVYDWDVSTDGKTLASVPKDKPDECIVYSKQ
jgi:hypothetical protein